MNRYLSCRYKVHATEEILSKAFPELFRHKEFAKLKSRIDCDRIVKYIVGLYDKNSLLIQEFQNDLKARKEEAAKDAGFQRSGASWSKEVQDMMEIRDHDVTDAIMRYLKIQKHNTWMDIVVTEQELFEYQELRFTPVAKKKKSTKNSAEDDKAIIESTVKKGALMKACDERIEKLKALYEEFFGDNKDLQEAEFSEAITPEKAERIMATIPPPYEEIKGTETIVSEA